jgi:hypothetical protein
VRDAFERVVAGAVNGGVATLVMTLVMAGERRLGLLGDYPPVELTDRAARRTELGRDVPERDRRRAGAVLHLLFGALAGASFTVLRTIVLRPLGRAIPGPLLGIAFGLGVWAASYAGWIPALGLLPPPSEDRPSRPIGMIAAHVVYGAVLGISGDVAEQLPVRSVGLGRDR